MLQQIKLTKTVSAQTDVGIKIMQDTQAITAQNMEETASHSKRRGTDGHKSFKPKE